MTASYLLDTSALGNHYLGDAGERFVADCIRKGADVCALSVFEFGVLLRRHGASLPESAEAWSIYRQVIAHVRAVDESVAALALHLRTESSARLPMADACIAACAAHHSLMLVHADSHFSVLPASLKTVDIRAL